MAPGFARSDLILIGIAARPLQCPANIINRAFFAYPNTSHQVATLSQLEWQCFQEVI